MSGPTQDRLLGMLRSGELHRLAAGCLSRQEFLSELGITRHAYRAAKTRLMLVGVHIPSIDDLCGTARRHVNPRFATVDARFDFEDEAPTTPGSGAHEPIAPIAPPNQDIGKPDIQPGDCSVDIDLSDLEALVPVGFDLGAKSVLVDADGNIVMQWLKSKQTRTETQEDRIALMLEAFGSVASAWTGMSEIAPAPVYADEDLLCVISVGDAHLGMHAWAEECGQNFDLEIAERHMYAAIDQLVAKAPSAGRGLLINLGDLVHADNVAGTTTGGTRLDVDTRFPKVTRVAVRTMRRCLDRMKQKFHHTTNINEIGNHDTNSASLISLCLEQYYENDPRVTIDSSPAAFHYYRFDQVLIGTHHGHGTKLDKLPGVMACDRARDWGETIHRHWIGGHVHHDQLKEHPGCVVETRRTLAPKDEWHTKNGYRAGQDMKLDVFHRRYGRIAQHTVSIQQLMGTEP